VVREPNFEKAIAADVETFAFVIALFAIVTAPVLAIVASPDIATDVGTFDALPTRIFPDVSEASFEKSIAAEADTLAFVIALLAIVNEPVFEIVASPETATEVGTFEAFPIKTLPDVKLASFEKAIAAEAPTFVLFTTPVPRVEDKATLPEPLNEIAGAVTSPVIEKLRPVVRVLAFVAVPENVPETERSPVIDMPVEFNKNLETPSIEPVIVPTSESTTAMEESPALIVDVAPPP
jgi:hypothetical protein